MAPYEAVRSYGGDTVVIVYQLIHVYSPKER